MRQYPRWRCNHRCLIVVASFLFVAACYSDKPRYAEIVVLDDQNDSPVPMVELETVHGLRFVTDNNGRIAFHEPGLMNQDTYFFIRSHGYEVPKDGFGYAGVKLRLNDGEKSVIKIHRNNVAVRIARLTGQGRYRDSILLNEDTADTENEQGYVVGQDSVQAAIFKDKIFWLWGDTNRIDYPLGLFRTAGATTPFPLTDPLRSKLMQGNAYEYFVDPKTKFARAMLPLADRPQGVVWMFGLFVVPDQTGEQRLVCHYSRRSGLEHELEQGIAVFDQSKQEFIAIQQLPLNETWRKPTGHPIHYQADRKSWMLFGSPTPNVRVPATFEDVLKPSSYESFVCEIDEQGVPKWKWQSTNPPTDSAKEQSSWAQHKIKSSDLRYLPLDARHESDRIQLHRGSVRWNAFRNKWIMIAGQIHGQSSMLGEIWYSESDQPTGPFRKAIKIVTHDRQSFYNVCHHDFLDEDNGRTIFFEGTYTNDFSGNSDKTPRYNYNQILYRLDLDDAKIKMVEF